jgi:hypothetical protein
MGCKATERLQKESPAVSLRGNFLIPWSGKQKGYEKNLLLHWKCTKNEAIGCVKGGLFLK